MRPKVRRQYFVSVMVRCLDHYLLLGVVCLERMEHKAKGRVGVGTGRWTAVQQGGF